MNFNSDFENSTRHLVIQLVKIFFFFFVYNKATFTVDVLQYLLQLCRHVIVPVSQCHSTYQNVISTSIDNQSLILVKCPLYNFVLRGICIFEKAKTTVGNQIVDFNTPFKRKHGYALSPCKRKTKTYASFNQTGVTFLLYFIKVNFFYKKLYKLH